MFKYYDGYRDNHDAKRPAIGITCSAVSRKTGRINSQSYTLTNILVNGGKFDTYVLKNRAGRTVKISMIRVSC